MKKICLMLVIILMVVFAGQYFLAPPVYANSTPEKKEPAMAGLFSFLIPGLGQMYVADWQWTNRVTMFIGVWLGAWLVSYLLIYVTLGLASFVVWILPLGWKIYAIVDAVKLANKYNAKHGFALLENRGKKVLALNTPEGKITLGSLPTQFQVVYR